MRKKVYLVLRMLFPHIFSDTYGTRLYIYTVFFLPFPSFSFILPATLSSLHPHLSSAFSTIGHRIVADSVTKVHSMQHCFVSLHLSKTQILKVVWWGYEEKKEEEEEVAGGVRLCGGGQIW